MSVVRCGKCGSPEIYTCADSNCAEKTSEVTTGRCLCNTTEPHPVSECTWPGQTNDEVFADDVRAVVLALGLGDHARPYSPHAVIHREVLPALAGRPDPQPDQGGTGATT